VVLINYRGSCRDSETPAPPFSAVKEQPAESILPLQGLQNMRRSVSILHVFDVDIYREREPWGFLGGMILRYIQAGWDLFQRA
jgi:hypothetical protein